MTQNLNHYEKILSRSHSNYLAQISIEMTDANNQINDVLSKMTALGTILIPMNLVTGTLPLFIFDNFCPHGSSRYMGDECSRSRPECYGMWVTVCTSPLFIGRFRIIITGLLESSLRLQPSAS
jgi:hypothetical protein